MKHAPGLHFAKDRALSAKHHEDALKRDKAHAKDHLKSAKAHMKALKDLGKAGAKIGENAEKGAKYTKLAKKKDT